MPGTAQFDGSYYSFVDSFTSKQLQADEVTF